MRARIVVSIALLTVILLSIAANVFAVQTNLWTSSGPKGALVRALAVSATNIYAGTTGAGVYLSTDDGQTWVPKLTSLTNLNINAITFSPGNVNTVLAGTEQGLFRSTTAGTNWTSVASIPANSFVTAVTFADASVVYAAVMDGGIYRSADGGATWSLKNTGLTSYAVSALAAASPTKLFAAVNDVGVYLSIDGGDSWSLFDPGDLADLTSKTFHTIAIDPSDSDTIYVGTAAGGIFKKTVGGGTWATLNTNLPSLSVNALQIVTAPARSYAATDKGICISVNQGNPWLAPPPELKSTSAYAVAVKPSAPAIVFAGTSGGMFKSSDSGSTWQSSDNGILFNDIRSVLINPQIPTNIFAGSRGGGIYKSTTSGSAWSYANSSLSTPFVNALAMDTTIPPIAYAGTDGGGLFKSTDSGDNWSAIGLGTQVIQALAVDPATVTTMFTGTASGLFKSMNLDAGSPTWDNLNVLGSTSRNISTLAAGSTPDTFFAGETGEGILVTTDGGTGWAYFNNSLSNTTINALKRQGTTLYAGSAGGVHKTAETSAAWSDLNTGLTNLDVRTLASDADLLAAGTYGGGVYLLVTGTTSWQQVKNGLGTAPKVQALTLDSISQFHKKLYAGIAGGGVAAITLNGTASVMDGTTPVASGATVDLGNQNLNSPKNKTITISNSGTIPLGITAITLTDAGAQFTLPGSGTCFPLTSTRILLPTENCTFDASFTPTTEGIKTALVEITNSDLNSSTFSINLRGTGITPPSSTIDFPALNEIIVTPYLIRGTSAATGAGIKIKEVKVSTDNGQSWKTATLATPNQASSNWSYSWSGPADGQYSILSRATNSLDLTESAATANNTKTAYVNNQPPTVTINAPTNNAAINGTTNVIKVKAVDPGAGVSGVKITLPFSPLQNAVYNAGTDTWDYTWAPLPPDNNSYAISVTATDSKGLTSNPVSIAVAVDTRSPGISVTRPTSDIKLNGATYTITGTANDYGGSGVQQIEIQIDGGVWIPAIISGPDTNGVYGWSIPWPGFPQDSSTHTIDARAIDRAGNTGTATQVTGVTIDNVPPTSTFNPVAPYLSGAPYRFTGHATDAGLGVNLVQVSTDNGTTWFNATDVSAGGDWSDWKFDWTLPADGQYTVKVRAIDAIGNVEYIPESVTAKVNNFAPVLSVIAPADGDGIRATYTVSGTAVDAGADVQSVKICDNAVYASCVWKDALTTGNWSTWSYSWTPSPDGAKTLWVVATDKEGKSTTVSRSVIADNVVPNSFITVPTSGTPINGTSYTIRGTASDGTGSGVTKVEVSTDNGATWNVASGTTNWSYVWTLLFENNVTHHLLVRATDKAGNIQASYAPPIAVTVFNAPPTSAISAITPAPVSPYVNYKGSSFTISGTANDLGLGVQKVQISLDNGSTWIDVCDAAIAPPCSSWSYLWTPSLDGAYTLRTKATSTVGIMETPGPGMTVTTDNRAPTTSFSLTPALYSRLTGPSFNFAANESAASYSCRLDTAPAYSCTPPLNLTGLGDGSHSFSVRSTDWAGNPESVPASFTWTVDTVAPTITATRPFSSEQFSIAAPLTVTFNEDIDPGTVDGTTILLVKGGSTVTGTVTYNAATRTATVSPKSATGQAASLDYTSDYTLTVTTGIRDLAGNPLAAPYTITFTTDPDGDVNLDGQVNITDALVCLKAAVGRTNIPNGSLEFRHGNVAPLKNGRPSPDSSITIGDAVVILERILGVSKW